MNSRRAQAKPTASDAVPPVMRAALIPAPRRGRLASHTRPPKHQVKSEINPKSTDSSSASAGLIPASPSRTTAAPSRMPQPAIETGSIDISMMIGTKTAASQIDSGMSRLQARIREARNRNKSERRTLNPPASIKSAGIGDEPAQLQDELRRIIQKARPGPSAPTQARASAATRSGRPTEQGQIQSSQRSGLSDFRTQGTKRQQ